MTDVVVADDQYLVREGLRALLGAQPDTRVVAEASTGEGVLRVVEELSTSGGAPDVVLLDVRLPGTDGIETTRRLTAPADRDPIGVVVTSTFEYEDHVVDAVHAGARGFVLKDAPPHELIGTVRRVARGGAVLSPRATAMLVDHLAARHDPARGAAHLTGARGALGHRDRTVLALVAAGLTDTQIARRLRVFPASAAAHVQDLVQALGVADRAGLVVAAYESGLVVPGRS